MISVSHDRRAKRAFALRTLLTAATGTLLMVGSQVFPAPDDSEPFNIYIADRLTYDDNPYRLPTMAEFSLYTEFSLRRIANDQWRYVQ